MINISKLYSNKLFLSIEIFILMVIPLSLIYLYPPIIHARLGVMSAGLFYVYLVAKLLHITPSSTGLTTVNFYPAIKSLCLPTSLFIATILLAYHFVPSTLITTAVQQEIAHQGIFFSLLGYLFISAPVQEIVMRTFLIPRLEHVSNNRYFLIIFTTLIFGTIHIPLNNYWLTISSYLLGILWAHNFINFRNFFALWLSHATIGSIFIYFLGSI